MNNETVNNEQWDEHCPNCEFGNLKPRTAAYTRWVAGQFITVPDFPVWVCDVCGYMEYDDGALEHLEALLGPGVELQHERQRAMRRAKGGAAGGVRPGQRRLT